MKKMKKIMMTLIINQTLIIKMNKTLQIKNILHFLFLQKKNKLFCPNMKVSLKMKKILKKNLKIKKKKNNFWNKMTTFYFK
jgi:hypothetical protein